MENSLLVGGEVDGVFGNLSGASIGVLHKINSSQVLEDSIFKMVVSVEDGKKADLGCPIP